MLSYKRILLFFIQVLFFYGLLAIPSSRIDKAYGLFYRKCCQMCFSSIGRGGDLRFSPGPEPQLMHVNIWNPALVSQDGTAKSATADVNTRYRGYMPSLLFLALTLASPVNWRRRLLALSGGILFVMALVMIKQWLGLLNVCFNNPWLNLYQPDGLALEIFNFLSAFLVKSSGTILYFTVVIWFVMTFRLRDLSLLPAEENR